MLNVRPGFHYPEFTSAVAMFCLHTGQECFSAHLFRNVLSNFILRNSGRPMDWDHLHALYNFKMVVQKYWEARRLMP
jgi:hypothetical protein